MKNQYFGDVNDYRKYGLLRMLTRTSGLRVGVCWMLTEDDERTDGQLRGYLAKPDRWKSFDQDLYHKLQPLADRGKASVGSAPEWDLIPNAIYFSELLREGIPARQQYFSTAWETLRECPLVFLDPDNGIEVPSTSIGTRGSTRYLYWPEIEQGFANGHSLLIYQHYPRVSRERFVSDLCARLSERLHAACVTAFCTPRVVFALVQQPEHVDRLGPCGTPIGDQWLGQIAQWRVAVAPSSDSKPIAPSTAPGRS